MQHWTLLTTPFSLTVFDLASRRPHCFGLPLTSLVSLSQSPWLISSQSASPNLHIFKSFTGKAPILFSIQTHCLSNLFPSPSLCAHNSTICIFLAQSCLFLSNSYTDCPTSNLMSPFEYIKSEAQRRIINLLPQTYVSHGIAQIMAILSVELTPVNSMGMISDHFFFFFSFLVFSPGNHTGFTFKIYLESIASYQHLPCYNPGPSHNHLLPRLFSQPPPGLLHFYSLYSTQQPADYFKT